ncbi:MAG: type VI secretion system baseplate subunit TssK [Alphaproteobacteria bacterium]
MPRSAHELPELIQWQEGMLLAPQHFQQMSVRGEELLAYHALTANPYHWGVRHLKIDPNLLVSGTLRIEELEAVLPDGLVVSHSNSDGVPLEIDLNTVEEDLSAAPLPIHLAVPVRRLGGRATRGDLPRYKEVEAAPVADDVTGDGEVRIPRMRPQLHLIAARERPAAYVGFPIAEVHVRDEAFTLTNFVPAQLAISSRSELGETCQTLAVRLREKAAYMAERAQSPASQADRPLLHQTQTMIHNLIAGLPQFEALLKSDVAHPFALYLSLCNIVGHMATVGGAMVPPQLPQYRHDNPRKAYDAASGFVIQMLDRVSEAYTALPFQEADGIFSLKIEPDWCDDDLTIGVRARREMTEADVIEWMNNALIGSESVINAMRERRVLGAERHKIDREGSLDIVPTRGVVLFRVEVNFDDIVPGEKLSILSGDRGRREPPQEIVLYIPSARGDAG